MFGVHNSSNHGGKYAPLKDTDMPEKRTSRSANDSTIKLVNCIILLFAVSVVSGLSFFAGRRSNHPTKDVDFKCEHTKLITMSNFRDTSSDSGKFSEHYFQGPGVQRNLYQILQSK
jgi:hypothetical protein